MTIIAKMCIRDRGLTGRQATFHTQIAMEYGTNVVAGVSPGHAGERVMGIPVFDTVSDAKAVSYTPLDVYKRQSFLRLKNGRIVR